MKGLKGSRVQLPETFKGSRFERFWGLGFGIWDLGFEAQLNLLLLLVLGLNKCIQTYLRQVLGRLLNVTIIQAVRKLKQILKILNQKSLVHKPD